MKNKSETKILIIDDTPEIIDFIRDALINSKYQVFVAISGEKGLSIVEQVSPDLILLDIMMPGLNGFDTCKEIKKIETVKKVPVIFMSALSETVDKVKAFESGGIDYLTKPVHNDELLARVQIHCQLYHLQEEMNQANVELREFNTVLTATQNALNKSAMVSVTDLEGKILKVNQQVCEVSQYSQEELIGQPCAIFNSGFHDDEFWRQLWKTVLKGGTWRGEIRNKRKDGGFFWVDTVISAFLDFQGAPSRFLVVRFLITDRKKLEAQLIQKNLLFTQSIDYAKNIQNAVLPSEKLFKEFFPDAFLLYRPKDIVSGDFYWMYRDFVKDRTYLAIVDCTGHGVPGGFMTMLGQSMLNNIILYHRISSPDEILDEMNDNVIRMLHQDEDGGSVHDGMDMAMIVIDHLARKISYSGAKRPFVYLKDGQIQFIRASNYSIGSIIEGTEKVYKKHEIDYTEDTTVYLYSDGITDQFDERQEYKFSRKRLQELLIDNIDLPLFEQGKVLEYKLNEWEGESPQIDDILVLGFKCQF